MRDANRDLLVLSDTGHLSAEALERELSFLNDILFHTERWDNFCTANELIDINRRKIIRKPHLIQNILSDKQMKAFIFISNRN